jgi:GTP-binding protein
MEERRKRLSTPVLNRFLGEITLPSYRGRKVRLLYMTQVGTEPPAFSIFSNLPEGVGEAQRRHIEAQMRERFSFHGTPIRLYVKRKV